MSVLDSFFAEDVEMQDDLEEVCTCADNSDEIILNAINDRAAMNESTKLHLFTNESCDDDDLGLDDDGLTEEEEAEVQLALLNGDEDYDDDYSDLDDDEDDDI